MGKSWPKCFIPPLVQTRQNSGNVAIDRVIERGCCGQGGGKYVIFLGEISTGKKIAQKSNHREEKNTKKNAKMRILTQLNKQKKCKKLQFCPPPQTSIRITAFSKPSQPISGGVNFEHPKSGVMFCQVKIFRGNFQWGSRPKRHGPRKFQRSPNLQKNHTSKILQQDPIQADAHSGGQRNQSKCTQGKGVSDRNKWQSSYACTAKGCMHWGRGVAKLWLGWNECFT